ncbi:MAG: hypothetical protein G8345_02830 [Magnetococcales bacterium]|nr:hypothetical protein [Magnetococcales bacterium]NGZ25807.1 hypothetical protein [Magnetococcales bacterium]
MDDDPSPPEMQEQPVTARQVVVDAEVMLALMEERMPFLKEMHDSTTRLRQEMKTFQLACKKELALHRLETKKTIQSLAMEHKRQLRELKLTVNRQRQVEKYAMLTRVAGMLLLALVTIAWIQQTWPRSGDISLPMEQRSP